MAGNYSRSEHIAIEDGKLCRQMFAQLTGAKMMVGKVYEDGAQVSRNIEFTGCGGWCFIEPGHRYKRYYGSFVGELHEWAPACNNIEGFTNCILTARDREVILGKYPEFHWVLDKNYEWFSADVFKILKLWKKNARLCETLMSMDLQYIAFNGNIYNDSDPWRFVKYLSRHPEHKGIFFEDLRLMLNKGVDYDEVCRYNEFKSKYGAVGWDLYRYLDKQKCHEPGIYRDYIQTCKKLNKNLKEKYWQWPKDLRAAHGKVVDEYNNYLAAKMAAEAMEQAKREKSKYSKFEHMMKRIKWRKVTTNGCSVYLPNKVQEVIDQAKELTQCLISCDYISDVVDKTCVLVFVMKDGKPYATAELLRKGRKFELGQFYGDEAKADCDAPEDAKKALKFFIRKNNLKMVA